MDTPWSPCTADGQPRRRASQESGKNGASGSVFAATGQAGGAGPDALGGPRALACFLPHFARRLLTRQAPRHPPHHRLSRRLPHCGR